ncbi:MAG: sporulation protein YqfC [Clostridiaceae bacterium]
MENKINTVKSNVIDKLDLPRDVVLDLPKIIVTGNNEITIENHKGIIIFDERQVKINTRVGLVNIYGEELEILFLGGSTISLRGKFKSVVYEEVE